MGTPFLEQNRPESVKRIYRALERDHPDMPASMKARIAARQGKPGKQKQGPPYKGPISVRRDDPDVPMPDWMRFDKKASRRVRDLPESLKLEDRQRYMKELGSPGRRRLNLINALIAATGGELLGRTRGFKGIGLPAALATGGLSHILHERMARREEENTRRDMKKALHVFSKKQGIDPQKAMVVAGGAAYLHGFRDDINDIDFFHPELKGFVNEQQGRFEMDGGPAKDLAPAAKKWQRIGGMKVQTPEAMLAFYQHLNRPKDQEKIKSLHERMAKKASALTPDLSTRYSDPGQEKTMSTLSKTAAGAAYMKALGLAGVAGGAGYVAGHTTGGMRDMETPYSPKHMRLAYRAGQVDTVKMLRRRAAQLKGGIPMRVKGQPKVNTSTGAPRGKAKTAMSMVEERAGVQVPKHGWVGSQGDTSGAVAELVAKVRARGVKMTFEKKAYAAALTPRSIAGMR